MVPAELAQALIGAGQRMDMRFWVPGSAGNLSARVSQTEIAITRSGVHKGHLRRDDIILVDLDGVSAMPGIKPSAETLLHCQLYRLFPPIGAVLHSHSVAGTVLSAAGAITFSNYEILKAFGFATHELDVILPVYENDQNIARLTEFIEPFLVRDPPIGYALAGHGLYAWGTSVEHAMWRLEALEFLLSCELERRALG